MRYKKTLTKGFLQFLFLEGKESRGAKGEFCKVNSNEKV